MLGDVSSHAHLFCGVPQGSILGPFLFTIYMLPLGQIIHSNDIEFHCYADETQLYVPVKSGTIVVLQLNDSKSEVLIITPVWPQYC